MGDAAAGKASFLEMVRYADAHDLSLMMLGVLGSFGDGMMQPLLMLVLGDIINSYGAAGSAGSTGSAFSSGAVDKFALRLLYLAVAVGACAFLEGVCWTRTAERQASRMRRLYLEAVLRQEVHFFDAAPSSQSTTFGIITTISDDADTIQDFLSEKLPMVLANVTLFFGAMSVCFVFAWRLALAGLPLTFLFFVPSVVLGKRMVAAAGESRAASIMAALPNLRYFVDASVAAARMRGMIEKLPPLKEAGKKGATKDVVRGRIVFKDVHFTYPSRPDTRVLNGVNLTMSEGATIGLVGGSGSGKSTVIALLQRFYRPDSGEILLDGDDIGSLNAEWLRSKIGLVSQEPVLFATSIRENILFGNETASPEQIIDAAKMANAHEFITKLPNGYDTHVGQFGTQMSGGQKQRIAIARALIRDPKILLLDEATSALDSESERTVQDALDRASVGRTTVIVAHRLSTLRKADTIAVLDQGRVVEFGTHDELVAMDGGEGGVYAKMVHLQSSSAARADGPRVVEEEEEKFHSVEIASPGGELRPSPVRSFRSVEPTVEISQPAVPVAHAAHPQKSLHLRLLKMNRPEWKQALLGCAGAIIFGAVLPLYSYSMGSLPAVYFLTDHDLIRAKTRAYSLIFLAIAIVCIAANIVEHYNFAVMGERLTERVRDQMLAKILSFEVGWFDEDENSSAAVCARLATQATKVRSLVGDRMCLLVQAGATASLGFALALYVSWRLAAVMMALQPLVIASFYFKKVLMTAGSRKAKKAQVQGSQLASEAVVNHRTITAFSSQRRMLQLYEAAQVGPRKDTMRQSWFSGFCLCLCQFNASASTALALWYGGKLMASRQINTTQLFQVFFILMSMGRVIADAGSLTSDLAQGGDAVQSILDTLDREPAIKSGTGDGASESDDDKEKLQKGIKGAIEFRDVHFSYPTRPEVTVLAGLSLEIGAGKTVALVGPSGSGKSTVIGLIERFYDVRSGAILIDGKDIRGYGLTHLRSHVALEVRSAAALANAHEFISGMEGGYDTQIGERGAQLSGGQRQRIALARAVLKNARILLLDEATSALDTVSERLVQDAVDRMLQGTRTCVVVAHRLSTVQNSDMIAVVKDGRVAERGTHRDLVALGRAGMYYNLIKLQHGASPCRSPIRAVSN
ncbi:ABC transporter B family member 15-like [Triticum urartu]|uniref:ABC transporter B family member 15-like n=1 Tax=Triticum dicoccoides TaxID=85692 RepID=UPI0018906402|nr:ABC transporter B family member 15-like [Triticum dicoccoides]XP_044453415.1 ABC transporter B family member 15-like [Triticum aestivum]XP_048552981.1 ABC transporter B family member 15-like [Triticum urartu]